MSSTEVGLPTHPQMWKQAATTGILDRFSEEASVLELMCEQEVVK